MQNTIHIKSISEIHSILGLPAPKHPLVSVIKASDIDFQSVQENTSYVGAKIIMDLYYIALKEHDCDIQYGRNHYDFDQGVLAFTAPKQVIQFEKEIEDAESGWMLFFHADLIRHTHLGESIDEFNYFSYDIDEALHISEDEKRIITEVTDKIVEEYNQRIDGLSQRVLVSNVELLLNYCLRYYERQFHTRTAQNKDLISSFTRLLKQYFSSDLLANEGIPPIHYFSDKLFVSQNYLSDILRKETSRSAKDHINDFVIERAKEILLNSSNTISEIAYSLGFNYPHYFTRMFKQKTGETPNQYRQLNLN